MCLAQHRNVKNAIKIIKSHGTRPILVKKLAETLKELKDISMPFESLTNARQSLRKRRTGGMVTTQQLASIPKGQKKVMMQRTTLMPTQASKSAK